MKRKYEILMLLLIAVLLIFSCGQKGEESSGAVPERSDIAEEYTWNLEDLYPGLEAWEAEFQSVEKSIPELKVYQGKLGNSGRTVLECLKKRDKLASRIDKLYVYANLSMDSDTRNPEFQSRVNRIASLEVRFHEVVSYIVPELQTIPGETLDRFIENTPGLDMYAHYFDDLNRSRPHVLSPDQERLLAMTGNMARTPGRIHEMLTVTDIRFPKVKNEDGKWVELSRAVTINCCTQKIRMCEEELSKECTGRMKNFRMSTPLHSTVCSRRISFMPGPGILRARSMLPFSAIIFQLMSMTI